MTNKELQESRMKGYFIQATKELLKSEGLKSLSVRNIADRAGYSYATMYNYFRDVKGLVFECVRDFRQECEAMVAENTRGIEPGPERIRAKGLLFLRYFTEYPGIFELFFLERFSDLTSHADTAELIHSLPDDICQEDWEYCLEKGYLNAEQIKIRKEEFRNMSAGLLLFYLNRRKPESYQEFIRLAKSQLEDITRLS